MQRALRIVGFQQRTITVEETDYSWHEYLFNPFKGFRYLTRHGGTETGFPIKLPAALGAGRSVTPA